MISKGSRLEKKEQLLEKVKLVLEIDLRGSEHIIFLKGVTDHRINLTLHKLNEFLSGDIFDEISDQLQLQFQEELLKTVE